MTLVFAFEMTFPYRSTQIPAHHLIISIPVTRQTQIQIYTYTHMYIPASVTNSKLNSKPLCTHPHEPLSTFQIIHWFKYDLITFPTKWCFLLTHTQPVAWLLSLWKPETFSFSLLPLSQPKHWWNILPISLPSVIILHCIFAHRYSTSEFYHFSNQTTELTKEPIW